MMLAEMLKLLGFVGGAFVAGLTISHQYLLPNHLAEANFKIARLEEQVLGSDNARLAKQLAETKAQLGTANRLLSETQKRVLDVEYAPIFEKGSVWPVGLRQVRPGDPDTRISEVFPASSIQPERDGDWISVVNQHKAFKDVTYYVKDNTITHVGFFVFEKVPVEYLLERLKDALGEPTERLLGKQKAYLWATHDWSAKLGINSDAISYVVLPTSTTSSIKAPEKQRTKASKQ